MTLQLLICTIDEGIARVADLVLPPCEGVSYLVSWQHSAPGQESRELPRALMRDDVAVAHLDGRGLSRNRNNCLRHATGDVCLICDDDCRYTAAGLQAVVDTFDRHRDVDLAAFMMLGSGAGKKYPAAACSLGERHAGYYPSSVELAFRPDRVRGRLQFNENFGLGAPLFHCSEEEIFVHDALRQGLRCRFFPVVVVEHDHPTTDAARATLPGVLMGKGAYLYIGYRAKMFFYPFPIAWRLRRQHGVTFAYGLRHLYKGLFHILRHPGLATAGRIQPGEAAENREAHRRLE